VKGYHIGVGKPLLTAGVFSYRLADDMEPTKAVEDKANNHGDYDDCDYPANESVDETETAAEDLEENVPRPGYKVGILEACRCLKCR